jgi:hypothetical protein
MGFAGLFRHPSLYRIIRRSGQILIFCLFFILCMNSPALSHGLQPIADFILFAAAMNVLQVILLCTWFALHWSNKNSNSRVVIRSAVDCITVVFSSFSLWFWGQVIYQSTCGNGLWAALTSDHWFFYTSRLVLVLIFILFIMYKLNGWILSFSRSTRLTTHFLLCFFASIGILTLFEPSISGPLTRLFINTKLLNQIADKNPNDYLEWLRYYRFDENKVEINLLTNPRFATAFCNQGQTQFLRGKYGEAISDYSKCIKADPSSAFAYENFSWLLSTCPDQKFRDGQRAMQLAEEALSIHKCRSLPSYDSRSLACAESFKVLAAAYAEIGNFSEAMYIQSKAISLLQENGYQSLSSYYNRYLESYKMNSPWRVKLNDLR